MAVLDIVLYPDPRLREVCAPVETITDETRKLLDDMVETMYAAPGIGLAAPQVAVLQRIVVVDVGGSEEDNREAKLYKLINPEIVDRKGAIVYEEGCLSIPVIRENVRRAESVIVEAFDENGEELTIEASGLLAICLQHEIDHINGVLFIDHLSQLKKQLVRSKLNKILGEST